MKQIFKHFLIILSCFILTTTVTPFSTNFTIVAEAHSGRTDSAGGHRDNKNKSGLGYYHYHHGYGPHLHTNGICPYSASNDTTVNTETNQSAASDSTITEDLMNSYSIVFDADYYYNEYSDLQTSIGNNPLKLFEHFYSFGMSEGRKGCKSFDVTIYKENNPDLQAVYGDTLKSYYEHYISTGYAENRIH